MRHFYLVSYDICDPRRLQQVLKTVRDFGDRLQLSVFLCQLSERELVTLRERLRDHLNQTEDQVLFIRLSPVGERSDIDERVDHLGRAPTIADTRVLVF